MADDKKISELTAKTLVHNNDLFVLVDTEAVPIETKKITAAYLKALIGAEMPHASRHEDGGADEIDLTGLSGGEIRLIPKASSTGAEGTIFYSSADKCLYVGAT